MIKVIRLKRSKVVTVSTVTGASVMAYKTLKGQLRFTYEFFLLMNAVGRTEEAKHHLVKLSAIINGINPALKAVKLDNLKQQAK